MADSLPRKLIQHGYNIVPVSSEGVPLVSYKDKDSGGPIEFTLSDVEAWDAKFSMQNFALVPGINNLAVLDVDITNVKAATAIRKALAKKWPDLPIRDCNPPRFACVFQVDESVDDVSTGWSDQYSDADGVTQGIEFSAWVKPVTLFGKHRKTDNEYTWVRGRGPAHVKALELPILSKQDIEAIFALFTKAVDKLYPDWPKSRSSRLTPRTSGIAATGLAAVQQTRVFSDVEVEEILSQYSGKTRDQWIACGMALHRHFKGSMSGLARWEMWARQWPEEFEEGACQRAWPSFTSSGTLTMGTLAKEIRKEKKAPEDLLKGFLSRYVFIVENSMVGDLKSRSNEALIPLSDANHSHLNKAVDSIDAKGNVVSTPVMRAWLSDPERKTVFGQTFAPGKSRVCLNMDMDRDKKYWNTYSEPAWQTDSIDQRHVDIFKAHIEYLFGAEPKAAEWFTNWLAHMIQQPWDRADIAPIHISTNTGTGRGWLSRLMLMLVGRANTSETSISKMCNEGGKNGYLANSILCLIPEVREQGAARYGVSEAVKKQITDEYINVDIKYGAEGMMRVYTRFFFQSNHVDAMVLDAKDRRFNVFANHALPKSREYYVMLHEQIKDTAFVESIYGFLTNYKFDEELLRTIVPTAARKAMVASTKSPTALAFITFSETVGLYTPEMLSGFMAQHGAVHGGSTFGKDTTKEIVHLEREYCKHTKQCTVSRKSVKVSSFLSGFVPDDVSDGLAESKAAIETYFSQWS